MDKQFSPLLPKDIQDKIIQAMPPALRDKLKTLPEQQQHHAIVVGCGLLAFVILWIVLSIFTAGPDIAIERVRPKVQPTGTKTAIIKSQPEFPTAPRDMIMPQKKVEKANAPAQVMELTSQQKIELDKLRYDVDHTYKNVLSFTLNEYKMISFSLAAANIDRINEKWDTMIAGAPNNMVAREYLLNATTENENIIQKTPGITISEYSEIYKMSARDTKFNQIANAYKNLVAQGIWGPLSSPKDGNEPVEDKSKGLFPVQTPAPSQTPLPATPATSLPQQSTAAVATPATPAGPGTAPAPAGSPTPPYSQPASR